jgi:hypothetical protein
VNNALGFRPLPKFAQVREPEPISEDHVPSLTSGKATPKLRTHNRGVAGSNPAPATKPQVRAYSYPASDGAHGFWTREPCSGPVQTPGPAADRLPGSVVWAASSPEAVTFSSWVTASRGLLAEPSPGAINGGGLTPRTTENPHAQDRQPGRLDHALAAMRARWYRGHLGRSGLGVASFLLVVTAVVG